jgi:amidohydrolase
VTDRLSRLRALVAARLDEAVALRRRLHRAPELGWRETDTTEALAEYLRDRGLDPRTRSGSTGLVVDVGSEGGPTVAFRADLDALPIEEATDRPYASERPGVMHACGHDAHSAIAAATAVALGGLPDLPGAVRFVFQPAEELIDGGGSVMAAEGALGDASSILAFHVDPSLPPGTVGLRTGPITGASDRIRITLEGPGGHTSRPHQTVDLIAVAGRLVVDLPTHVRRVTDPRRPVAMVFGTIHADGADNVIPARVEMGGTVRLFDLDLWRTLPAEIERLVHEIVAVYGAAAKVEYEQGAPPVVNDHGVVDAVQRAVAASLGRDAIRPTEQSLGSEDFSWFLEHVPGALVRLGAALPGRRVDLHSADFDIDERAIEIGMLVGAASLVTMLEDARRV